MDNKAYLDQIAVKETKKGQTSLLSPGLIKLILGALVLIVMLIVIISIFSGQNKVSYNSYAELQARYSKLLAEDSPMLLQKENLHSSELRANTASFVSLAKSFLGTYTDAASSAGIDVWTLSSDRNAVVESDFSDFSTNLNDAYMNGYLDQSFASECSYQLAVLIQLEDDIYKTTANDSLKEQIYTNMNNLKTFQQVYEKYGQAE